MDEHGLLGRSLQLPDIDLTKDGQSSGAVSSRIAQLLAMLNDADTVSQAPIAVDPGDFARIGDERFPGIALTLPIAYDVWYLFQTVNVLPAGDADRELFVRLVLKGFLERFGGISPMRSIARSSLKDGVLPDLHFFQTNGFHYIKQMRYETFLKDRAPEHVSKGSIRLTHPAQHKEGLGEGDFYAGYLAFPVGPLGVMEQISFVCESMLKEVYAPDHDFDGSYDAVPGNGLLTPIEANEAKIKGLTLYEKAYLPVCPDVEYPADPMDGHDSVAPHHWLRLWLQKQAKWPVPGEFVGLAVKPLSMPPHCWWFQESSPLFYSGNWFETDYYTSGTVLAVLEPADDGEYRVATVSRKHEQRTGYGDRVLSEGDSFDLEGIGNIYKVRVKEHDIYLKPTDFRPYEVDERVAVVKGKGIDHRTFKWTGLRPGKSLPGDTIDDIMQYDNNMAGKAFELNTEWVVAPITFFRGGS